MNNTEIDLNAVAWHESAHAVAARRANVYVVCVRLKTDERSHGGVVFDRSEVVDPKTLSLDDLRSMAMIVLSGPIASTMIPPHTTLAEVLRKEGAEDARELSRVLDAVPETERTAFRKGAEREARKMVKTNWGAIENVAVELLKWKYLSGTMLDQAISGESGPLRAKAVQAAPRTVSQPPKVEEPEPDHPPIGAMIFEPRG